MSVQEMDFQRLLLQIGQSLDSEDVKALAFLCTDISQRSLNSVELFSDLCSSLTDQDLLSADRPQLLQELLLTIQRPRLVRDIRLTEQGPYGDLISPYRKLLYNLYEDLTDGDLRNIKFLLNKKLPRRKLDENVTTLELFLELEQMELLGQTNLDLLQSILESVCPALNEKIIRFKQQHATHINSTFEELHSFSSASHCVDENQHVLNNNSYPLNGGTHVSGVQPFPQPFGQLSIPSSNTSVDFPRRLPCHNYEGVLPRQVSDASAETSSSPVEGSCCTLETSKQSTGKPKKPILNLCTEATNVEELEIYPMTGAKRGICLIVNNYNFKDKKKREGTQIDQECLERVFGWLGFQVEVHNDCTGTKMLSVAKGLSGRDHRDMDCVVCCFLSHGDEGSILGVDDEAVGIRQLTRLFNGQQCPSLVDKPKLFFIQACQGVNEQQAVSIETDDPTPCSIESDAVIVEDTIPSDADFLLGMATVPSFVSYREKSSGSWYIQALCKNLVQMVPRGLDLVSILTRVNADVSQKTGSYFYELKKQMPQPAFSLRKKVIFPVPSHPPPNLEP